jgi:hypothetical protein
MAIPHNKKGAVKYIEQMFQDAVDEIVGAGKSESPRQRLKNRLSRALGRRNGEETQSQNLEQFLETEGETP